MNCDKVGSCSDVSEVSMDVSLVYFQRPDDIYTPGIYAKGYIDFVFPLVRSFVRNSVQFVELLKDLR